MEWICFSNLPNVFLIKIIFHFSNSKRTSTQSTWNAVNRIEIPITCWKGKKNRKLFTGANSSSSATSKSIIYVMAKHWNWNWIEYECEEMFFCRCYKCARNNTLNRQKTKKCVIWWVLAYFFFVIKRSSIKLIYTFHICEVESLWASSAGSN